MRRRGRAQRRSTGRLERAVRAAFARPPTTPEPAADADLDVRLRYLEDALNEVRSRVNALFFAVLGSLALELFQRVALR